MRIIHTADWHLGKNLEGRSRLPEQELFLQDFCRIVEDADADLVLIAGDVYDTVNPPSQAEKLFYDTLKKISGNGKRLTVVIAGNHDNPQRLVAAAPLAAEHGVLMAGTPGTVIEPGRYGQHRVTASGEGYVEVEVGKEKAVILTVPFPSEKRLNEVFYKETDTECEQALSYGERIKRLFDSLGSYYREDTVNLAVSHLFVMESREDGSERSISLGGSYLVEPGVLPEKAQYVALGHIHKPQAVPGNHRAWYSGSPLHYRKGEEKYEKNVLLVEAEAGGEAKVTPVPVRQYKPIEVWRCKSIEEAIRLCERNAQTSCWVYLEIETDRPVLEDEIRQMKHWKEELLEIRPVFSQSETEEQEFFTKERPFDELFKEFYLRERGVPAAEETMQALTELMGKGEEHETD